jgi:hypothetical protein
VKGGSIDASTRTYEKHRGWHRPDGFHVYRRRERRPGHEAKTKTIDVPFTSHDGYPMFGKLTLPEAGAGYPVVIYVQTADGMTVDMKRSNGRGGTFITGNLPDRHKAIFEFINDHVRKK